MKADCTEIGHFENVIRVDNKIPAGLLRQGFVGGLDGCVTPRDCLVLRLTLRPTAPSYGAAFHRAF
jgi:hypothetical protein